MNAISARTPRLFVAASLRGGVAVTPGRDQCHYLANVMRCAPGDAVVLFNGRDGEWAAVVERARRKTVELTVTERLRPQENPPDIHYCFAVLKRARLDFIAQKATELGAARLQPLLTRHTVADRVKTDRLVANATEAAEQCGILWVPEIAELTTLEGYLDARDPARTVIFGDEAAARSDPLAALAAVEPGPVDVLVGPEGGFSAAEREMLRASERVLGLSLGPRIMRADTAGIAALSLVQAVIGDWRGSTTDQRN